MRMRPDQLRAALEVAGWRVCEANEYEMNECKWYAWLPKRPATWPDCECNDKPPSVTMRPFFLTINGLDHGSVEFGLCGELHGRWHNLTMYSVAPDEAMDAIPEALKYLGAAWCAIAEQGEKTGPQS